MGDNGENGAAETGENRPDRDEKGLFVPGCPAGPGRPRGRMDLMDVARKKAREHDVDLEDWVWAMLVKLYDMALKDDGNLAALQELNNRLTGMVERTSPEVAVQINQAIEAGGGLRLPEGHTKAEYYKTLAEVVESQGLLEGGEDAQG